MDVYFMKINIFLLHFLHQLIGFGKMLGKGIIGSLGPFGIGCLGNRVLLHCLKNVKKDCG
jgi:hypothetical protein